MNSLVAAAAGFRQPLEARPVRFVFWGLGVWGCVDCWIWGLYMPVYVVGLGPSWSPTSLYTIPNPPTHPNTHVKQPPVEKQLGAVSGCLASLRKRSDPRPFLQSLLTLWPPLEDGGEESELRCVRLCLACTAMCVYAYVSYIAPTSQTTHIHIHLYTCTHTNTAPLARQRSWS